MYKLPKNFTGYDLKNGDIHLFKTLCYSLQGLGLIKINTISGYSYLKNYYVADVSASNSNFYILMNCYCDLIAFAEGGGDERVFIDRPEVEEVINQLNPLLRCIHKTDLQAGITDESMSLLSSTEIKQLKYWLPQRVGDVLYSSFFD